MSITQNWRPVWLAERWDEEYVVPRPQWLKVEGGTPLLYPGEFHMLYGRGGHGKTMFAVAAAVSMARSGLRTVFLDYEGTEALTRHRLKLMGLTRDEAALVGYQKMLDGMRPNDVSHMNLWCQENEVQLLVVDSVARALASAGLDELDNKGFSEFIQMLEPLRTGTQAVLLIDHIGHKNEKRDSDSVPSPRGASAKVDQVAVAYYFNAVKPWNDETSGYAEVMGKKCRHGQFSEGDTVALMHVNVAPGTLNVSFSKPGLDPRFAGIERVDVAEEILEIVAEGQQTGLDRLLRRVAQNTKRPEPTCRVVFDQMVSRGLIQSRSLGVGKSTVVCLPEVA